MGKDEKALLELAINRIDEIAEQLTQKIEENKKNILIEFNDKFERNFKTIEMQLNSFAEILQSINQKSIDFETRFKEIENLHIEIRGLKSLNEGITQKISLLDTGINNTINSVKDSTNSVKESISSSSDADKTRYQSLLTSLEEIPKQLSGSLSTVAGPIVSQSVKEKLDVFSKDLVEKIKNILISQQTELQTALSSSVENTIEKQKEILEMIRSEFVTQPGSGSGWKTENLIGGPYSRDLEEVRGLINYFQRSPKEKKSSIIRIEQVRDSLIADRTTEAPYRVTASRTIREALSLLSAETRDIPHHINTQIIKLFEDLQAHILSSS